MSEAGIRAVLEAVMDPEIPVVSIMDLGIVRAIETDKVTITPTYSGCPATDFIERNIREALDIDSMDFLNFVLALHARFGIDIPEADYPRLSTLDGAVAYIASKSGQLEHR